MKSVLSGLLALLVLSAGAAQAEQEAEKKVGVVVTNSQAGAFFGVENPEASKGCFLGLIKIDIETAIGRAQFASILNAKTAGVSVTVDFTISDQGCQVAFMLR